DICNDTTCVEDINAPERSESGQNDQSSTMPAPASPNPEVTVSPPPITAAPPITTTPEPSLPAPSEGSTDPVVTAPTPTPPPASSPANEFAYIDPERWIQKAALDKALQYYKKNASRIKNKNYLSVIDFSLHNSKKRFYLIDMKTGAVEKYLTAHGKNSDTDFDGYATVFSNTVDSKQSSVGFYLTAETYSGQHGYSLRLDGLSSTNSKARERYIVIHGADYVRDGLNPIGRSWGCPAVDLKYTKQFIDKIKNGSVIFAWHPQWN
ncbi:MAG: murein L,D-transpeptidase catalytic domain family protein, partial [Pseudobdellovibrionaceae bacterium]